ncbi:MAG: CAP domain-containing protein [Acidobacteriaceae bacterium]
MAAMPARLARAQSDAARDIFALTNQDRQAQGLPALQWNEALAGSAEAHARLMAQEPTLEHQYPGEPGLLARANAAGAHFDVIAENIALGPNPGAIERAWMHSTPHRTNILDPRMNALGVAVVNRGGTLYAVEDFAQASQALSVAQVEQKVRGLLRAQNVDASLPAGPAEGACRMWRGMPEGTNARAVVRFETPDLSRLPAQVEQQIENGHFTRAAVGACAAPAGEGFTTYRVTLLLY